MSEKLPKQQKRNLNALVVAILWIDAVGSTDNHYPPHPIITVGFPIKDADDHIVVASEYHADGGNRDYTTIPKSIIRGVFPLKGLKVPKLFTDWRKEVLDN